MSKYEGKDNYGNPKSEYLDTLKALNDNLLRETCNKMIWLSAYANNNPGSDYHWQCDACYDECSRRDKVSIYEQEHANLVAEIRGH